MKSIHFCTPLLLESLKKLEDGGLFSTIRTGWITHLYPGDTVKINHRYPSGIDFLFHAQVEDVFFLKFTKLMETASLYDQEEINRYGRKFHDDHYFFKIIFRKL